MAHPGLADRVALLVGALTVLALGLRIALLHDSLLGDELILYGIVHDRGLGDVLHIVRETEKTPPLHFVLAWASAHAGDPRVTVRLPSLAAGTALVPLAYLLGRRTVGRAAGVVAAAIVALQPYLLFYSTEARAYALVAFLTGVSTLCLLHALETNRRGWWAAYGLAVLAAAYTHYVGAFVLLAQAAWAFWAHRERLRELVVVHVLVVLAYLPWLPSFLLQQDHSGEEARRIALLAPPSVGYFVRVLGQVVLGEPFVALRAVPGRLPVAVAVVLLLAALAAAAVRARRGARPFREVLLVVALALATPAGIALLSLRPHESFLLPRNVIASSVPIALVIAALLVALGRRAAVAAVTLFLLVLAVGTIRSFEHENRRSQYRSAASWIDARARPGDPVVEYYFVGAEGPLSTVLALNFDAPHPVFHGGDTADDDAWRQGRTSGHVFVVLPLPGAFKRIRHLPAPDGPGKGFTRIAEHRYDGIEDILVGEYVPR